MSPAPLLVAVAAGLAGAGLAALPGPSAPPPTRAAVAPVAPVGGGTSPALPPPARVAAPAARFRWPLSPAPQVLRRFAVGPQPWSPGHRGVDLAATAGQQVLSAGAGTVTFAGTVAGRGVVAVGHGGGLRTTYEPVTPDVRAGEAIAAGARVGVVASGSHCPATCLHWGALRRAVYLDPLTLLRPLAPPILLPLAAGRQGDA